MPITVGVIAFQGSFHEHCDKLHQLIETETEEFQQFQVLQVKTIQDLRQCQGFILPGGESTAHRIIGSNVGQKAEFWNEMRRMITKDRIPTWGTCAGAILLCSRVMNCDIESNGVETGQLAVIDCTVCRNYFGRQSSSFILRDQSVVCCLSDTLQSNQAEGQGELKMDLVFIRAPAFLDYSPKVKPISTISHNGNQIVVGVQQDNVIATAFHPELLPTNDSLEFHRMFLRIVVVETLAREKK